MSIDEPVAVPLLAAPADGVPEPVADAPGLRALAQRLQAGTGPVAIDAERASGHRYGQRAFLIQLRRDGCGTALVDPVGLPDLAILADALTGPEWILHAATQDLPCLAELRLRPAALFDTELAARLLGLPRVGLAGLTEDLLGVRLAKGHGAADWSRRPLPAAWLSYAALDVELLHELRDDLIERLNRADRLQWAAQEFAYLCTWAPRERPDAWRQLPGLPRRIDPRDLAIARELWQTRDTIARAADQPPGRIASDKLLVAMLKAAPDSAAELARLPGMAPQRRRIKRWWQAISTARDLPPGQLPDVAPPDDTPPPARAWDRRDPAAAERLAAVRAALSRQAEHLQLPPEVLVAPESVRSLLWSQPQARTTSQIADELAARQVRPWQIELVAPTIAAALPAES